MSSSKLKDFETLQEIGKGSYGVVHKVRRKGTSKSYHSYRKTADSKIFVIKQINIHGMSKQEQQEALNECKILASFDHPYIIRYYDSIISTKDFKLHIIMEFAANGSLHQKLQSYNGKKLPEAVVWKFFLQITCGLYHIHSKHVLHRDLKSMNIFLDENDNVKIGDFGVSKVLDHTKALARTMVGTPYYLSPELCENQPYGMKSDVWALGCILYELCTLKHPFDALNQGALILKIIRGTYTPIGTGYSQDLSTLLKNCLNKNTAKRLSSAQILMQDVVVRKCKELNISLPPEILQEVQSKRISAPLPIPSNQEKAIVQPPRSARMSQQQKVSQKQEELPISRPSSAAGKRLLPIKPQERAPSVIGKIKPMIVMQQPIQIQPQKVQSKREDLVIPSKSKDIEAVKNLPSTLVVKKDAVQEVPTKEINVLSPTLDQIMNVPSQTPLNINVSIDSPVLVSVDIQQPDEQQAEHVTWKIHDNVENSESSVVAQPILTTSSGKVVYDKSRPRMLDRAFKEMENLEEQKKKLVESIAKRVGKEKTEQLITFFHKLSEEDDDDEHLEKVERIHNFVYGRIAYTDADIVDCIYQVIYLDTRVQELSNEVTELLSV